MVHDQNNLVLYGFTILGTCVWGFNENLKGMYMRPWCREECPPDCTIHRIPASFAVVWEMVGAVAFLLVIEVLWTMSRGALPVIMPIFWFAMTVTAILNLLMENIMARARQIEVPAVIVLLSATMPAWVIVGGWFINHQWPTPFARWGILVIACATYCIKLTGSAIEPPWIVQAVLPKILHRSATFLLAPWIRLFGLAGARTLLFGVGPFKFRMNGAMLAVFVAWCSAISVNFDWIAITSSDPMIFSAVAFAFVGISTYLISRGGEDWADFKRSRSVGSFSRTFFCIGVLRGIVNTLVCIPAFYTIGPNMGALRRIFIVWTIIFSPLFEVSSGAPGERFIFWVRLMAALGMAVGCAMIAF